MGILLAKFAATGALASCINYGVFLALVNRPFTPVIADMIAYASGVAVNFVLHRRFLFEMKRSLLFTFAWYMLASTGGLALSAGLTYLLIKIPFFAAFPAVMKLCTMGIVFFYNFFSKRFAFEKRFIS